MRTRTVTLALVLAAALALPALAQDANLGQTALDGLGQAAEGAGYNPDVDEGGSGFFIGSLVRIFNVTLSVIGLLFFVLIMRGGFVWMTARGNEDEIGRAKKILSAAIGGLVVVVLAQALALFMLEIFGTATGS